MFRFLFVILLAALLPLARVAAAQQVNPLLSVRPALQKKFVRGEFPAVLAELNQLLKADSLNPDHLFLRAECYLQEEKYEAALADFERASRVRPNQPLILMERGLAKLHLSRFPAALADFEQALLYDPKLEPLRLYAGCCRLVSNDLPRALQDLTAATGMYDVRRTDAWMALGIAQLTAGKYAEALQSFNEHLRRLPRHAQGHAYRALAYLATGQKAQAQADMAKALKLTPTDVETGREIRLIDAFLAERTAATQPQPTLYAPALAEAPDKAEFYLQRGDLHWHLGDLTNATADWQQAAQLGSVGADFRLKVGYQPVR